MPTFKTQSDISWNYDIEGNGEVLLFIHGWGVDRRIWRQQYKYFIEKYRVIVIDLPGHGETTWKKLSMDKLAEDIKAVLDHLEVTKVTIVGSSLGGMVGLKIHEQYSDIIQRLVFVGSMPKFARSEDYPYGLDVEKIRKLNSQVHTSYPSIVDIFFRSLFTEEERKTRRFKWLQRFRRDVRPPLEPALEEYLDILEHEDLRHVLPQVKVSMLFINGTGDEICTPETVAYLREVVPQANFHDFENAGHFSFLTRAYEFNAVLDKFLC